jgi:DNA polymerase-1
LEAFNQGEDIHERTAREVFGALVDSDLSEMRRRAKVINFGIIYGLSAFGLSKSLKISRSEAQDYIDGYFERYSGVKTWSNSTLEEAEQTGYVKTLFGRIRQIPEIKSRNWNQREFARRIAINAPIQGTAADLMKMAMVAIHERINRENFSSKLTMQVHDELVFEVYDEEIERLSRLVEDEMEGVAELSVPLKVDLSVGPSWYEAK